MKWIALTALLALGAAGSASPARAEGCIKGAVVGGVAGHLVGHGIAGAAVGCAVGHHEAVKADRERRAEDRQAERPDDRRPPTE